MEDIPTTALNAPFLPLCERVVNEATVIDNRILRIDHFLNHRIEPAFMAAMGEALAARLAPFQPDLILTAEASGIAPALAVSSALGVPLLYAKKYAPVVEPPALSRLVTSPTKGSDYRLVIASRFLAAGTRVALVDDFLANGRTAVALAEMAIEAGCRVVAAGFIVEKRFQGGRGPLEALGIPVGALACVERLDDNRVIIEF